MASNTGPHQIQSTYPSSSSSTTSTPPPSPPPQVAVTIDLSRSLHQQTLDRIFVANEIDLFELDPTDVLPLPEVYRRAFEQVAHRDRFQLNFDHYNEAIRAALVATAEETDVSSPLHSLVLPAPNYQSTPRRVGSNLIFRPTAAALSELRRITAMQDQGRSARRLDNIAPPLMTSISLCSRSIDSSVLDFSILSDTAAGGCHRQQSPITSDAPALVAQKTIQTGAGSTKQLIRQNSHQSISSDSESEIGSEIDVLSDTEDPVLHRVNLPQPFVSDVPSDLTVLSDTTPEGRHRLEDANTDEQFWDRDDDPTQFHIPSANELPSLVSAQSGSGRQTLTFSPCERESAFQNHLQDTHFVPDSPCSDPQFVFNAVEPLIRAELEKQLRVHHGLKYWLVLVVEYENLSPKATDPPFTEPVYLRSSAHTIHNPGDIDLFAVGEELMNSNANTIRNRSGLRIKDVRQVDLEIAEFMPLSGGAKKKLPHFLSAKKVIVNIDNTDNRCFGYAILASKYYALVKNRNGDRPAEYNRFFAAEGLEDLDYPINPLAIPELENRLNLKINVFSFFDDEGRGRHPYYISRRENYLREVNLMYWDEHYAWIRDISGLFSDLTKRDHKIFFCLRCLGHFRTEENLEIHSKYCSRENFNSTIYTLPKPDTKLKFKNEKNQMRFPFVIYADFECILNHVDRRPGHYRTQQYQHHSACAVGLKLVAPSVPALANRPVDIYTGEDCVEWMLRKLLEIEGLC